MNIRKEIDYSAMYTALDCFVAQERPYWAAVCVAGTPPPLKQTPQLMGGMTLG